MVRRLRHGIGGFDIRGPRDGINGFALLRLVDEISAKDGNRQDCKGWWDRCKRGGGKGGWEGAKRSGSGRGHPKLTLTPNPVHL